MSSGQEYSIDMPVPGGKRIRTRINIDAVNEMIAEDVKKRVENEKFSVSSKLSIIFEAVETELTIVQSMCGPKTVETSYDIHVFGLMTLFCPIDTAIKIYLMMAEEPFVELSYDRGVQLSHDVVSKYFRSMSLESKEAIKRFEETENFQTIFTPFFEDVKQSIRYDYFTARIEYYSRKLRKTYRKANGSDISKPLEEPIMDRLVKPCFNHFHGN